MTRANRIVDIGLRSLLLLFVWLVGLAAIVGSGGGGGGDPADPSPSIVSESGSQTAVEGTTATFSITAENAQSYQWQIDSGGGTWTAVPGATGASLSIRT